MVPVGSYEDHGLMPPETDILIARCVTQRAEAAALKEGLHVVVLPPVPYSTSPEHSHRRRTVSVSTLSYASYVSEILSSAASRWGAGILAVFHGGAYYPSYTVVRELRARGMLVALYNFWGSAAKVVEEVAGCSGIHHADEVEASILAACGYNTGIVEASLQEVVGHVRSRCKRLKPRYEPWMGGDFEELGQLYPRSPVPASAELGLTIVKEASKNLVDIVRALSRGYQNSASL